jgi:glycosyltransferase involved in cell wall biosynthesis
MSADLALAPSTLHPAAAAMTRPTTARAALACRYLLAIHVPLYIDARGQRWTERLWMVDLQRHTDYITHLTVLCPFLYRAPPPDCVSVDPLPGVRFEPIAWFHGAAAALLRAPHTLWRLWRIVGKHDVVHSIYGHWWLFETPYLVNAVARVRGRFLIGNIESSDWRLGRGDPASPWRRFKAWAGERMNRAALGLTHIAFFTHEGYRDDLMPQRARGHVLHASWIDEADVLDRSDAIARWHSRPPRPLRAIFVGRLQEDKGVAVLLEALQTLRQEGTVALECAILGAGPLAAQCREHSALTDERVRLSLLDPVPYGPALFALLRDFDVLVVPSLADEQPRVVYDAYSQALAVLAAATPGLASCVQDGVTGRLFVRGDAAGLASALSEMARRPPELEPLAMAGLELARAMTHQEMHRRRHALIAEALAVHGLA